MRKILVTGAVGFIGFHLTRRLLEWGETVVGLDNLNPYYDVTLKEARFALPEKHGNFSFVRADLADRRAMEAGLYLYRRHCGGDHPRHGSAPGDRSRLERQSSRSLIQLCALPYLQDREQPARRPEGFHHDHGGPSRSNSEKELSPPAGGDVPATFADVDELMADVGFKPATPIAEGIGRFAAWYPEYYQLC